MYAEPLLYESDLTYLGSFRVPHTAQGSLSLAYGGWLGCLNPDKQGLFIIGHPHHRPVCEITIPALVDSINIGDLNQATLRQDFVTVLDKVTTESHDRIGDLLVIDGQLWGTAYEYYDAEADSTLSLFRYPGIDLSATPTGLFAAGAGDLAAGYYGGWLSSIPPQFQSELGSSYFCGQSGIPIASRQSIGPAVMGFDPSNLGVDNRLLYYTLDNPIEGGGTETSNDLWNGTTNIRGAFFPKNSRSVLFFGDHGYGTFCYGTPGECNDPYRDGKGNHVVGGDYRHQVWAYDALDLIRVENGEVNPWDVQPYDYWNIDFPFSEPSDYNGGIAWDEENRRLYVSQLLADKPGYDPFPIIHVYSL